MSNQDLRKAFKNNYITKTVSSVNNQKSVLFQSFTEPTKKPVLSTKKMKRRRMNTTNESKTMDHDDNLYYKYRNAHIYRRLNKTKIDKIKLHSVNQRMSLADLSLTLLGPKAVPTSKIIINSNRISKINFKRSHYSLGSRHKTIYCAKNSSQYRNMSDSKILYNKRRSKNYNSKRKLLGNIRQTKSSIFGKSLFSISEFAIDIGTSFSKSKTDFALHEKLKCGMGTATSAATNLVKSNESLTSRKTSTGKEVNEYKPCVPVAWSAHLKPAKRNSTIKNVVSESGNVTSDQVQLLSPSIQYSKRSRYKYKNSTFLRNINNKNYKSKRLTQSGFRLGKKKILYEKRKRISDYALAISIVGIIIMIVDTELVLGGIYTRNSKYSLLMKSTISFTTLILLLFIIIFHALEIKIYVIDNGIEDWLIAITRKRVIRILSEIVVCSIHIPPYYSQHNLIFNIFSPYSALDGLLSLIMFFRLLFTDASSRSIGAINRITFNTRFVLKTLMTICPGTIMFSFVISFWLIVSWTFRICECTLSTSSHYNILNSLWLTAITFLSIGYGDVVPETYCGRVVSILTGVMGAGCTALVVAVAARKLELTRAEKHVHNFMMDTQLTKALRNAAADVLRETWFLYKYTKLSAGVSIFKVRHHQRKFLNAIYRLRKIKLDQRKLNDSINTFIDMAKPYTLLRRFDLKAYISVSPEKFKQIQNNVYEIVVALNNQQCQFDYRIETLEKRLDFLRSMSARHRSGKSRSGKRDVIWAFGYGSNMDIESVMHGKHANVIESRPSILNEWKITFNLVGIDHVEPAYACINKGDKSDVVHGVSFCMTLDSMKEMDETESGYVKEMVDLFDYDGNKLRGFVYVLKPGINLSETVLPSKRYINLMIRAAEKSELKSEYIDKLKAEKTYMTPQDVLKKREDVKNPKDYPVLDLNELSKHNGDNDSTVWVSVLGYIFETSSIFKSHKGRDITTRALLQFNAFGLDDNDDKGQPPYPIIKDLSDDEKEYVHQWRDHYLMRDEKSKIVGYLKEFFEQQKSGKTTWTLPKV
ncbi:KCa2.1 [Intoshia linei]|uniref:KCa2.1 n=1 Tax=Intoshia linei TaxID=1819745 RepID=A0A177BA47_9BILA|nr:KCa2.1 [Intoshia linei]